MNEQSAGVIVERIVIAFFASLPPTIMALAALVAALRAYRQAKVAADRLDGRLDQLVKAEKARARLEGTLEGQAEALMPPARSEVWPPAPGGPHRGPSPDLPPPAAPADRPGGPDPPHE